MERAHLVITHRLSFEAKTTSWKIPLVKLVGQERRVWNRAGPKVKPRFDVEYGQQLRTYSIPPLGNNAIKFNTALLNKEYVNILLFFVS